MNIKYINSAIGDSSDYIKVVHAYIKKNLGKKFYYGNEIRIDAEELKNFINQYFPCIVSSTKNNQTGATSIEMRLRSLSSNRRPFDRTDENSLITPLWEYDGSYLTPLETFKDAIFQVANFLED